MSAVKPEPLTDLVRLWDVKHPYYACEGNYYQAGMHQEYGSWSEFVEAWSGYDIDQNLVYRWDWYVPDPADFTEGEEIPGEALQVYWMGQRKAKCWSTYVTVTREDEPAIRAWLTIRAERIRDIWEPLL